MIRLFSLSLLFTTASWSAASACSPPPPRATTDLSYEEVIAQYSGDKYRNLVSNSDNIVVGEFKYSKKHKAHRLYISEVLKRPDSSKKQKRVKVSFNGVSDDRVDYVKPEPDETSAGPATKLFHPMAWEPGIEGTYGPGDCGISLDLFRGQEYIVFADKGFTVKTTFFLTENTMALKQAFLHLIESPAASKGIAFSIADLMKDGTPVSLLETSVCLPSPEYRILGSSSSEAESNVFEARSIVAWGLNEGRYMHELDPEDYERASREGLQQGLYKDAPALKHCTTGQKYLSLGSLIYRGSGWYGGQMIPEENGYFYLDETVFENAFSPEFVSISDVSELLAGNPE